MASLTCLLDTSVFLEFIRHSDKSKALLVTKFQPPGPCMSAVTCMELEVGSKTEQHRAFLQRMLLDFPIIAFGRGEAAAAGRIYQDLRSCNQVIEVRDLMIAATAVAHDLPLATLNQSHFGRVDGLRLLPV